MESEKYQKIKNVFNSDLFCQDLIDTDLLIDLLKKSDSISIIYGETYDAFGLTLDSLKYYLILEYLSRIIQETGVEVRSILFIGDTASITNENVTDKDSLLEIISQNIVDIKAIKCKYNLSFDTKLMSDVFKTEKYKKRLEEVARDAEKSTETQSLLEKTVLQNRLKQENKAGFRYALEEIALISKFELKLGPPREQFYDKASQIINNCRPLGIYAKPTYPLGLNYDYFINNPEIEEYGLTPYKAGSNRLQRNRFILNKTTMVELEQLINTSFIPKHEDLPDPLGDLYSITKLSMAVRTNSELDFTHNYHSIEDLTKLITDEFHEYIK